MDGRDGRTAGVCGPSETSVCHTSETHYVLNGQGVIRVQMFCILSHLSINRHKSVTGVVLVIIYLF